MELLGSNLFSLGAEQITEIHRHDELRKFGNLRKFGWWERLSPSDLNILR